MDKQIQPVDFGARRKLEDKKKKMEACNLHSLYPSVSPSTHFTYLGTSSPQLPLPRRLRPLTLRAANGDSEKVRDGPVPRDTTPSLTPSETVEIRFRPRGSRKRRQQYKENVGDDMSPMMKAKSEAPLKKWEDMTLSEKALELYVGEKGLLFWLNKLAYASIYAVIGGWILFRFVGPSLNLYQLDSAPLSPTSIFKT